VQGAYAQQDIWTGTNRCGAISRNIKLMDIKIETGLSRLILNPQ
jgi:hypothetical protein